MQIIHYIIIFTLIGVLILINRQSNKVIQSLLIIITWLMLGCSTWFFVSDELHRSYHSKCNVGVFFPLHAFSDALYKASQDGDVIRVRQLSSEFKDSVGLVSHVWLTDSSDEFVLSINKMIEERGSE